MAYMPSNLIACIWDFDKTLLPGVMQEPLFKAYGIDSKKFWKEVRALPEIYAQQNISVSEDFIYLNHLISYVKNGPLRGLNNAKLREFGAELQLFEGLPEFFKTLKELIEEDPCFKKYNLKLEHYIISCGLTEMIRGSKIAPYVDGIYGCEFIEEPMLPGYLDQECIPLETTREISQIGRIVDNTSKTRHLFEINKGSNKNPTVNVNSHMLLEDRRIPVKNMIYIADGPSDIPMFAVIKERGGKTFAVHHPDSKAEFMQNDLLLQNGRVDCFGPADYRPNTFTYRWLTMHVQQIAETIVQEREQFLKNRVQNPPSYQALEKQEAAILQNEQANLFE